MDFIDQITALSARIPRHLEHIATEEATKNALVLPFINALGYNVFDPTEVVPEFTADVGIKKGEKVDYAIFIDGKPLILFECKGCSCRLNGTHSSQLFRYFTVTDAKIGVLTNGLVYRFYSDLDEVNKMDTRPFLEIDLLNLEEPLLQELKKLTKGTFDLDQVLSSASELKYLKAMRQVVEELYTAPSDEFVKYVVGQVYDGRITQAVKDQFAGLVRRAFQQFINEKINGRLASALKEEDGEAPVDVVARPDASEQEDVIVTTEEEREAFYIVRAILREVVDVSRVHARDVRSYFGVLLDDNNRKPICRFHFNTSQRYIGLFNAEKVETRTPIKNLDQIYDFAEYLKRTVGYYETV